MRFTAKGQAKLKALESFRERAYMDEGDVWTIGWGRIGGVKQGDVTTKKAETEWFHQYCLNLEVHLARLITTPLNDQEHDALMIWAYNIGTGAVAGSTLRDLLNAGERKHVPAQLARWIWVDGEVSPGLMIRRASEIRIWQSGRY